MITNTQSNYALSFWVEARREPRLDSLHVDIQSGEAMFTRARAAGFIPNMKLQKDNLGPSGAAAQITRHETWIFRSPPNMEMLDVQNVIRGYAKAIEVPMALELAVERGVPKSPEPGSLGARDLEYFLLANMERDKLRLQIVLLYLLDTGHLQRNGRSPKFAEMNGQQVAYLLADNWHRGDRGFMEHLYWHDNHRRADDLVPPSADLEWSAGSSRQPARFSQRLSSLERRLKITQV